jgi:electron transfer flavoprotein beta subunit
VRDIEGGSETVQLDFPFVLSASKGLAEQRIPNMRGIMMAKRKALNVVEPNTTNDQAVISGYELPSDKQGVKLIDPDNVEELVRLLKEEAKAI